MSSVPYVPQSNTTFLTSLKTSHHFQEINKKKQNSVGQESYQVQSKTQLNDAQNQTKKEPFKLARIIKKYKVRSITKSFISRIKRNNIYTQPSEFDLSSQEEKDNNRRIKLKAIDINSIWLESIILFGDIITSLLMFYISVLQAFVQGFVVQQYENPFILILKSIAVLFEFSKLFLKIMKSEYYKGVKLEYVTDVLLYSTGLFDLFIYVSAVTIIIVTIFVEVTKVIGLISFIIASVKMFKTSPNMRILEVHFINSTRKQQYWNLIKVIIFNLFFGHLIAGVLIGMSNLNRSQNWIIYHQLENESWQIVYTWALYWSSTLITTTGFGDFSATNEYEAIIIAFLQFSSSVVLVYNINLIGTIVMKIRQADQTIEKKLAIFRRMNDETPINSFLQKKIHSHIEFQTNLQELFQFHDRNRLVDGIPKQLKYQYFNEVNQMIFKSLPFFRHLRVETMNLLANSFSSSVVYPSQYLIRNRFGKDHIFVLKKGKIGLAYQKLQSTLNGTIVQSLETNTENLINKQPILITNFFLNRTRSINFDVIAMEYSLIMKIKESELLDIIRQSDLDRQHYFTVYDKQEFNFIFKNQLCQFCPKEYHNKFECPKLHYMPFKTLVINRFLRVSFKVNHRFSNFKRMYRRKEHCYYLRKQYYEPCQDIKAIKQKRLQNCNDFDEQINSALKQSTGDQSITKEEFLQRFESIFRKVFDEKFDEEIKEESILFRINFEVASNYLSYFNEWNPDKLINKLVTPREKTLKSKDNFEELGAKSNKFIYRKCKTLKQVEEQKQNPTRQLLKQTSLKLL